MNSIIRSSLNSKVNLKNFSRRTYLTASANKLSQPFKKHQNDNVINYTFYDSQTSTWQYILHCNLSKRGVIIDPVLNYDLNSGVISSESADGLLEFIENNKLKIDYVLETHAHADHISSARYLKSHLNVPVGIGKRIKDTQKTFAKIYNIPYKSLENSFDKYFDDDEIFRLGDHLNGKVIHLPGHTSDHIGYQFGKYIFTGDSIFLAPTYSARTDFPNGKAEDLYESIKKLLSYPSEFKLFVGHDYPSNDRHPKCWTTVGEQNEINEHFKKQESFIEFRQFRDKQISSNPKLLHQSMQMNIRGGRFPEADDDGQHRFKLPIKSDFVL